MEIEQPSLPKGLRIWLSILAGLCVVCIFAVGISAVVCDSVLKVQAYDVSIDGIKQPFTAVLLTDLHSKEYGEGNAKLLELIRRQNPDVIFAVGDMINGTATEAEAAEYMSLLEKLLQIAPVYVSYGNHEAQYMSGTGTDLAPQIRETGAVLLNEECRTVEIGENQICLGGTLGHLYPFGRSHEEFVASAEYQLMERMQSSGLPTIVLAHLPDTIIFVHAYEEFDIDLFLSGHTHGGVIRLPGIGGLYAPMQGWFPSYDKGYFSPGKIQLIISAGLAGHGWIPRIFNYPEICTVHVSP